MLLKTNAEKGIIYREWSSPSVRACLLLVHGLCAQSERWKFLSEYLLARNISSYALELKGFGETGGIRGDVDSLDTYIKDTLSLAEIIKNENRGKKIFLAGESLGGLIAFLTEIRSPEFFSGLVCISPAFKSRLKFKTLDCVKIPVSFLLNPKKQFSVPFDSGMCTSDAGYIEQMDNDPREHRLATSRLLVKIGLAQLKAGAFRGRIAAPVLFLIAGAEDRLVDPEAAGKVFFGLKAKDKELIRYPQMRHALSIESGREEVFKDILKWVERRI